MEKYFFTAILMATICAKVSTIPVQKNVFLFGSGSRTILVDTSLSSTEKTITFTIKVKTNGWVRLGVNSQPNWNNADMVVGGVREGKPYHYDMHGINGMKDKMDTKTISDWELVKFSETSDVTGLKYTRLLKTSDPNIGQDYEIKIKQPLYLLWAYGDSDDIHQQPTAIGYELVSLENGLSSAFGSTYFSNSAYKTNVNYSTAYILSILSLIIAKIL